MLLNAVWTDEQILEINERAIRLFEQATEGHSLSPVVEGNVYTGILNMCGQVEPPKVRPSDTMHIPGGRRIGG